jgi:hypothetical protein
MIGLQEKNMKKDRLLSAKKCALISFIFCLFTSCTITYPRFFGEIRGQYDYDVLPKTISGSGDIPPELKFEINIDPGTPRKFGKTLEVTSSNEKVAKLSGVFPNYGKLTGNILIYPRESGSSKINIGDKKTGYNYTLNVGVVSDLMAHTWIVLISKPTLSPSK